MVFGCVAGSVLVLGFAVICFYTFLYRVRELGSACRGEAADKEKGSREGLDQHS